MPAHDLDWNKPDDTDEDLEGQEVWEALSSMVGFDGDPLMWRIYTCGTLEDQSWSIDRSCYDLIGSRKLAIRFATLDEAKVSCQAREDQMFDDTLAEIEYRKYEITHDLS